MKRARDIRDQLEGLLERVEIEISTNLNDLDVIKKAITSGTTRNKNSSSFIKCVFDITILLMFVMCKIGFFHHAAKLQKNGSYRTLKNPQTVYIHPSSGLAQVPFLVGNFPFLMFWSSLVYCIYTPNSHIVCN